MVRNANLPVNRVPFKKTLLFELLAWRFHTTFKFLWFCVMRSLAVLVAVCVAAGALGFDAAVSGGASCTSNLDCGIPASNLATVRAHSRVGCNRQHG